MGPEVIEKMSSRDVMFFSVGSWINYDISYYVTKAILPVMQRKRNGTVIWIGMDYVGHLKPEKNLHGGQNNTNALRSNEFMKHQWKDFGFDGYVDFFNLTMFADQCAQREAATHDFNLSAAEDRDKSQLINKQHKVASWANFDGTHATAEPNRMMFLGLLAFLQNYQEGRS